MGLCLNDPLQRFGTRDGRFRERFKLQKRSMVIRPAFFGVKAAGTYGKTSVRNLLAQLTCDNLESLS